MHWFQESNLQQSCMKLLAIPCTINCRFIYININIWYLNKKKRHVYSLLYQSQGQDRRQFLACLAFAALIAWASLGSFASARWLNCMMLLGPSFCVHQMLSLLSFTMNLPHISYWTQTQSISFTLCWLVIGLFNRLQTNHKHSGKGMWCRCELPSLWESIVWRAKRQLQRRRLDPFLLLFTDSFDFSRCHREPYKCLHKQQR